MPPRIRALLLLTALVALAGCGPTDEEVARAVLFVTPVPIAVGFGVLWGLRWAWRKLRPELAMDIRPSLYAIGFAFCFSGVAIFGGPLAGQPGPTAAPEKVLSLAPIALWAYGTGYLAILLVAWRIWLRVQPRTAFTWSFVVPLLVLLPPAAPLACGLTTNLPELALVLWVWTGAAGISPGVALVLAALEVFVRLRVAKSAKRLLDPGAGLEDPRAPVVPDQPPVDAP